MPEPLTLMAVHAHPDDEAIGTGGVLAHAAASGVKTVLVTCTGGEVGEISPHTDVTAASLAEVREGELRAACEILNVSHLELLGYRDSGMAGTPDNEHPEAFARADLDHATSRVVELVRKYRPQVIVTYDENGFYGHPDHINAHRVAVGAFARAGDPSHPSPTGLEPWQPAKLYYTAVAQSAMVQFGAKLREAGVQSPVDGDAEAEEHPWGTPDHLVTTVVDVTPYVEQKRAALFAHATQMGPDVFFSKIPPALFHELFGQETFRLVTSHVEVSVPEGDLFSGLR